MRANKTGLASGQSNKVVHLIKKVIGLIPGIRKRTNQTNHLNARNMNKTEIVDGYERLMHKASYTKSLIKDDEYHKALINAKNVVADSKFYLRHLGAFVNAKKAAAKASKKSRAFMNGISKTKKIAKKKAVPKSKPKSKPKRRVAIRRK